MFPNRRVLSEGNSSELQPKWSTASRFDGSFIWIDDRDDRNGTRTLLIAKRWNGGIVWEPLSDFSHHWEDIFNWFISFLLHFNTL